MPCEHHCATWFIYLRMKVLKPERSSHTCSSKGRGLFVRSILCRVHPSHSNFISILIPEQLVNMIRKPATKKGFLGKGHSKQWCAGRVGFLDVRLDIEVP